ncbi:hypothetical protein F4679DRAFT_533838 [Xylaria curta]|nr:hypothetical protein F4679DRAFT_533838 [Xylaria curta]
MTTYHSLLYTSFLGYVCIAACKLAPSIYLLCYHLHEGNELLVLVLSVWPVRSCSNILKVLALRSHAFITFLTTL